MSLLLGNGSSQVYEQSHNNKTYPVLPAPGHIQLRIISGVPECEYQFQTNIPEWPEIYLNGIDYWEEKYVKSPNDIISFNYNITVQTIGCPSLPSGSQRFKVGKAYTLFLQPQIIHERIHIYEDHVNKPSRADPLIRNLGNIPSERHITWKSSHVEYNETAKNHSLVELRPVKYDVYVDNVKVHEENLRRGGVYAFVIANSNNGTTITKLYEITKPNSMNILWLLPQYIVMTLGEVMFSITGLEFSYSQAPETMKSVLQACWLLTVAFGNIIVVVVAEINFFQSQASEFFLFAALMFLDMIVFMGVAYLYKPNNAKIWANQVAASDNGYMRQDSIPTLQHCLPQIDDH